MNNNFNLSQGQMEQLLAMAGKRMGKNPEELREQVETGRLDGLLGGLPEQRRAQIGSLLNDPAAMQQFMENPKVQQLLRGLMGK